MIIKENAFVHISKEKGKAILFDTYTSKKFYIPIELAELIINNELNSADVELVNDLLADKPEKTGKNSRQLPQLRLLLTNKCNFRMVKRQYLFVWSQ